MPLLPKTINSYGFQIKQYIIEAPSSQAAPLNIMVYQLPDLPTKPNTNLSEYYARCQFFKRLDKFKANYYIDNLAIWNTAPAQGKSLKIAICGTKQKAYQKAIKLISNLAKDFSIPKESIIIRFENETFTNLLENSLKKIDLPHMDFSQHNYFQDDKCETEEAQITLDYQVYIDNQWTLPIIGKPIHGLRFILSQGSLTYRVWCGGTWWHWTTDEFINITNPIEGFQYDFQLSNYELQFRVHFINSNWTPWKSKCLSIPYKKKIDGIEFKLIKEGEK